MRTSEDNGVANEAIFFSDWLKEPQNNRVSNNTSLYKKSCRSWNTSWWMVCLYKGF